MGDLYSKPEREGSSPYTRSGIPPPKMAKASGSDKPRHRLNDPMSLELHLKDYRFRAEGLTDAEREWRKKWILDQKLHPDEPIRVDAVNRQLNPARRLYRAPWDMLYREVLAPKFGVYYATLIRNAVPKFILIWLFISSMYYKIKYEPRDWSHLRGIVGGFPKQKLTNYRTIMAEDPSMLETAFGNEKFNYFNANFPKRIANLEIIGPPTRPW